MGKPSFHVLYRTSVSGAAYYLQIPKQPPALLRAQTSSLLVLLKSAFQKERLLGTKSGKAGLEGANPPTA